ncbi:MAG: hypothetical protein WD646_04060 [Actinomycetota bacterium]
MTTVAMSAEPSDASVYRAKLSGARLSSHNNVHYRVRATYDSTAELSDEYFLTFLDQLTTASPKNSRVEGSPMVSAPLGTAPEELGFVPGNESATVMPASFAADEGAQRLYILDTAKARIVSYDFGGRRVSETPLKTRSKTVTDIVVEPGTGRRYLVDQTENEIIRWDSSGQTVIENAEVKREPRSMRLAADGEEVYVRKASQGEHAPAVRDMKPVTTQARASDAKGGATTDTRNGINVEVGEDELVVADTCGFDWGHAKRACSDGSTRGIRVDLPGLVDVRDHVLDLSGQLWALGGVIDDSTDELTMLLLKIDLLHGTVIAREVDGSVPGDATRQLAPLESGVVLLEGDNDSLEFTRYNTL